MAKTEVYSWRVDETRKQALEEAARDEEVSLAELLDRITASWLVDHGPTEDREAWEKRVRAAAIQHAGSIAGGDPTRAEQARERVRERLRRRRS